MAGSSGKRLVIVESPTKAKTIRKFLGKGYMVESCMGHVRDLPQSARDIPEKYKKEEWAQLGVNPEKCFEPIYVVPGNKSKIIRELSSKLKDADELFLATDEDREGESISWHLLEILRPRVPVKRMVFHEITKEAINEALERPRGVDFNLVSAQEARRILDRLVGYTISPLLWKKVAYGLSAGRVQSVAVRMICQRELERMKFHKAEYWSVTSDCEKGGTEFESRLLSVEGKRVATGRDFDENTGQLFQDRQGQVVLLKEAEAKKLQSRLKGAPWKVTDVEEKPVFRKPPAPFITSTLQQEANRKLGMGAREAMRVAQTLYEKGLITYMRTDSTNLSEQALKAARKLIAEDFGKEYLPDAPRVYGQKKVKGAQEAHEAIRPAGAEFVHPQDTDLGGAELKIYEMIWMRTVASQMVDSRQKQVSVKFEVGNTVFSASGNTIEFPGWLKAYQEGRDEDSSDEKESRLPALKKGDSVTCKELHANQHETKPPARYTEASLIQAMEKEGIGRPSTYAPTIATIMDRGYVKKIGNALIPTFTAVVVNKMLEKFLPQYVDLQFTSTMEGSLDQIADGDLDQCKFLKSIWSGKEGLKDRVEHLEDKIEADEARGIRFDTLPGYEIRVGRYGAYAVRLAKKKGDEEVNVSLPDNVAPADLTPESVEKLIIAKEKGTDALCKDPKTGQSVFVLTGRYGPYVQLGEADQKKVKRVSIPPTIPLETVDSKMALRLLELPKTLGMHPGTNKEVKVGYGRFGPYIVHDGDFRSVPKTENFLDTTFERAMELLSQPKKGRGRSSPIKELGDHPSDGEKVAIFDGKYGPYIKWGKINVSVPQDKKPESVTLAEAVELLASKKGAPKTKAKAKTAKASESKPAKVVATKAAPAKKVTKTKKSDRENRKNPS